jgi:hypothetical protein
MVAAKRKKTNARRKKKTLDGTKTSTTTKGVGNTGRIFGQGTTRRNKKARLYQTGAGTAAGQAG